MERKRYSFFHFFLLTGLLHLILLTLPSFPLPPFLMAPPRLTSLPTIKIHSLKKENIRTVGKKTGKRKIITVHEKKQKISHALSTSHLGLRDLSVPMGKNPFFSDKKALSPHIVPSALDQIQGKVNPLFTGSLKKKSPLEVSQTPFPRYMPKLANIAMKFEPPKGVPKDQLNKFELVY